MAWYDEAVFYHIYPLGLVDAPRQNDYSEPVHRLNSLLPWIDHMKKMGFSALYIGPLFQSVGHGYETTDYKTLDSRLGTNEDLAAFVKACHEAEIKVIFDGVFNHTGRDFFAFRDIREKRESSPYRDWYCNVNFYGNNEYNDGFSYDNWGGYNLLVKLNQRNPAVRDYICDVIRFWVSEFDVDGIRLDAADVLDFDFMKALRRTADEVKPDFWLMGEVIHGDYSRWANAHTLHSVTNYTLHKGLYSGHNDHNYFEIAHTVRRLNDMIHSNIKLYNFVDNHDVERIITKLSNKAHYMPVHILLYTLPGIPSVYYGSEFGVEGRKERHSDESLRPYIDLEAHSGDYENNPCTKLIAALGKVHRAWKHELAWGQYRELCLTNRQFAFARGRLIVAVNNDEQAAHMNVVASEPAYVGLLSGERVTASNGRLDITLSACGGEIYAPESGETIIAKGPESLEFIQRKEKPDERPKEFGKARQQIRGEMKAAQSAVSSAEQSAEKEADKPAPAAMQSGSAVSVDAAEVESLEIPDIPYEEMTVKQLQAVILSKMAKNGPVTDRMRRDVMENIWHNSLVNWAKSFR